MPLLQQLVIFYLSRATNLFSAHLGKRTLKGTWHASVLHPAAGLAYLAVHATLMHFFFCLPPWLPCRRWVSMRHTQAQALAHILVWLPTGLWPWPMRNGTKSCKSRCRLPLCLCLVSVSVSLPLAAQQQTQPMPACPADPVRKWLGSAGHRRFPFLSATAAFTLAPYAHCTLRPCTLHPALVASSVLRPCRLWRHCHGWWQAAGYASLTPSPGACTLTHR